MHEKEISQREPSLVSMEPPSVRDDTAAPTTVAPGTTVEWKVGNTYPVFQSKLFLAAHRDRNHTKDEIEKHKGLFFSSTLQPENYNGYCDDFGPTDLAGVVTFCRSIRTLLQDPRLKGRSVVYYTEADSETLSNAAFLLGAYLVLVEGISPEDAAAPFVKIQPTPFKAFHIQPPPSLAARGICLQASIFRSWNASTVWRKGTSLPDGF